jgi:hypothetical protein
MAAAVLGTAKPQANTYQSSAAVSSRAIKTQTAMSGHNVFRPDVYRVSEGTVI